MNSIHRVKSNPHQSFHPCLLGGIVLLNIPGCFLIEGATTSDEPFVAFTNKCLGPDDSSRDICIVDEFCDGVYPLVDVCNFHWNGSIDDYNNPSHQQYIVNGCADEVPVAHMPCYPHPDPDTDTAPLTSGNDEAGTTTGQDTEGPEQYWICNYDSDEMCFLYYDPDSETRDEALADPGFHEKCWSVPPKYPCFYGTMSAAKSACELDCATERTNSQQDCADFGDIVIAEMGGETHDTWECVDFESTMVEPTDISHCDRILPVWEGAPAKTFAATVAIVGSDGGSTSQLGLKGYLTMRTENCTKKAPKCDLVVEGLEGSLRDLSGIYTDPTGAQTTYAVDNFDFRIMQQIRGEWYPQRGTITFPTGSAKVTARANSITLDQTMLTSSEGGLSAEQITGSYVDGVLTLTIAYRSGGNLIVASIETTN